MESINFSMGCILRLSRFFHWLTWVFSVGSDAQCHLFCCCLWVLRTERNKRVNEHIVKSGKDIARFIFHYVKEFEGTKEATLTAVAREAVWVPPLTE